MLQFIENYIGYKIQFDSNANLYVAKKGRKIFSKNADLKLLKASITRWEANISCSQRIDAVPQAKSSNPNVIRK